MRGWPTAVSTTSTRATSIPYNINTMYKTPTIKKKVTNTNLSVKPSVRKKRKKKISINVNNGESCPNLKLKKMGDF
jgi:hypothetical protein